MTYNYDAIINALDRWAKTIEQDDTSRSLPTEKSDARLLREAMEIVRVRRETVA